jgi:hypothetical protein
VRRGKTPVLTEEEARRLLEGIDTSTLVGLRDRALIGVTTYAFARIGAVVGISHFRSATSIARPGGATTTLGKFCRAARNDRFQLASRPRSGHPRIRS